MSVIGHRIVAAALTLALSGGVIGTGAAQPSNHPAIRRGHRTGTLQEVWVPGFWDLTGSPAASARAGWVWTPGRWVTPPMPGAHWVAGDWGWRHDWWSWIPGHWDLS